MARTTVDLDPQLVEKVIAATGEPTKGRALNHVMEDYLRRLAIDRLLAARGAFPDLRDPEEWHEKDLELELEEHRRSMSDHR